MQSGVSEPTRIDPGRFEWNAWAVAALEHPTLPWFGERSLSGQIDGQIDAQNNAPIGLEPLTARQWSDRDALSILAQYAAHQSLLNSIGFAEHGFDPDQWGVVRKRDRDVRLIRIGARLDQRTDPLRATSPAASSAACAEFLGVDQLDSLNAPWNRPDVVYIEAFRRAGRRAGKSSGDLRWVRRAAVGQLLVLDSESHAIRDSGAITPDQRHEQVTITLSRNPRFLVLDFNPAGGSLLQPRSGLQKVNEALGLDPDAAPDEIVDAVSSIERVPILSVRNADVLDSTTTAILTRLMLLPTTRLLISSTASQTLNPGTEIETLAPGGRLHVIAPTVKHARSLSDVANALPPPLLERWIDNFVSSDQLDSFFDRGAIPRPADPAIALQIPEPKRSYLSAIAVAGDRVEASTVRTILDELGSDLEPSDLAHPPLVEIDSDTLIFDPHARPSLLTQLPDEANAAISELAIDSLVESGEGFSAAKIAAQTGNFDRAAEIIETLDDRSLTNPEAASLILSLPDTSITTYSRLAERSAVELLRLGHYDRATAIARAAPEPLGWIEAMAARRQGKYETALSLLEGSNGFETHILRTELFRLLNRLDEARAELKKAQEAVTTDDQEIAAAFQGTLLLIESDTDTVADTDSLDQIESSRSDLGHRLLGYLAMENSQFDEAERHALLAVDESPDIASRIDAALDLQQVSYLKGNWEQARERAHQTLALIEQTDGDRAAGGVLFLLGFLSADEGRWDEAEILSKRLTQFYRERLDEKRAIEIDLIKAQIALGKLDLARAGSLARGLLASISEGDIALAAQLVLGEIDWIEGRPPPAVDSESGSLELRRRALLQNTRAGHEPPDEEGLHLELARWEQAVLRDGFAPPPSAERNRDRLILLRSVSGVAARTTLPELHRLRDEVASALDLSVRKSESGTSAELEVLRATAQLASSSDIQLTPIAARNWVVAYRNRLDRWIQYGSATLPGDALERSVSSEKTMIDIDDRRVWMESIDEFDEETRIAIARLLVTATRAHEQARLEKISREIENTEPFEGIIGNSPAVRHLTSLIRRLARSDLPLLIHGPSGTGKELVARAIHSQSDRRRFPFTPVNCAALPLELAESEFFGSMRGAFTGADRDRAGLIETTSGGTLFLDEIGEMPLLLQAKLLRFLQEGEFRRVGDTVQRSVDVRIVAATNRRLEEEIDAGNFREDLYYRICGTELSVPPLRERGDDVLVLADAFLERLVDKDGGARRFSSDVRETFLGYGWPGNVRELQAAVRTGHAMAGDSETIELDHIYDRIANTARRAPRHQGSYKQRLDDYRRELLRGALDQSEGNQAEAARSLGMSRQALSYLVRELGIRIPGKS